MTLKAEIVAATDPDVRPEEADSQQIYLCAPGFPCMVGFSDAVNGYYDVKDQLSRYLLSRADDHLSDTIARKQSIDSREEFEAWRERIRETFLERIGGLPTRSNDLAIETTGTIDCNGYTIELLTFESQQDFHVTANCYIPDSNGPHPGLLFCCGHSEPPKADQLNQKACVELAMNGFVVCIFDPVCQGERKQYYDPETDEAIVSGGGGVFGHSYAGQKCFYAGMNLARYFVTDGRCALDYLHERSDVDTDRIGVTGTSGGGLQTLYLGFLDDRVDVAAPCCAVSERYEQMKTGNRTHAEQAITSSIPAGIDYDALLAGMVPRPVCVGAAASDRYFPVEGVHGTMDRVRRWYDLYDAETAVDLVVGNTTHCAVWDLREGVFTFLCHHLGDSPYESWGNPQTVDPADLQCTSQGSVRAAFSDERTIDDLIREYVAEIDLDNRAKSASDGATCAAAKDSEDAINLRHRLVEKFDLDRERPDLHPRYVDCAEENGFVVEHVWFKTEHDPDIVVAGVLVSDRDTATEVPAVTLYGQGTDVLSDRSEEIIDLASRHGAAFLFDPRGVGAVRHRPILVPNWADDYSAIFGTEFKLANDALLLGDSLLGMRVFDTLRAVDFLRETTGVDSVSFVGEGTGAYYALYAAAVAENVDQVRLRDATLSFRKRSIEREVPFDPGLTAYDVLDCDLSHLNTALEQRNVDVMDPLDE